MNIKLRYPRITDAKRFVELLDNDNFVFFIHRPNLEEEKKWIIKSREHRKKNFAHQYAITLDGKVIGGCGIKIDQHRSYIGEIGYFVAEEYWGKGIATKAVKILEKIGFKELGLKRISIVMNPKNKASEKVAIKCGYKKEGLMKSFVKIRGKYTDSLLYAKVK
jgi:ribosomal-protein-alanine N-acetyltransferase